MLVNTEFAQSFWLVRFLALFARLTSNWEFPSCRLVLEKIEFKEVNTVLSPQIEHIQFKLLPNKRRNSHHTQICYLIKGSSIYLNNKWYPWVKVTKICRTDKILGSRGSQALGGVQGQHPAGGWGTIHWSKIHFFNVKNGHSWHL